MAFIRWYFTPVIIGFTISLIINPAVAVLGVVVWTGLIYYISRRSDHAEL